MKHLFWLLLLLPSFGHSTVAEAVMLYEHKHYEDAIIAVNMDLFSNSAYGCYWGGKIRWKMGDFNHAAKDFKSAVDQLNGVSITADENQKGVNDLMAGSPHMMGDLYLQQGLLAMQMDDLETWRSAKNKLLDLRVDDPSFYDAVYKNLPMPPSPEEFALTKITQPLLHKDQKITYVKFFKDWAMVFIEPKADDPQDIKDNQSGCFPFFYKKVNDKWVHMNNPQKIGEEMPLHGIPDGLY